MEFNTPYKLGYSGYYIHDVYTSPTSIVEVENTNKTLIKVTNILGKESTPKEKGLLFYIYSDGTVEKRIVVE